MRGPKVGSARQGPITKMAYFNLEDLSKIKKEQLLPVLRILRIALFVVLAIIVGVIVYFQQRGPGDEKGKEIPTRKDELTEQKKKAILESLSAPSDTPQYTKEEKKRILENLSAPSDQPTLSDEEKKAILESLSAPQQ